MKNTTHNAAKFFAEYFNVSIDEAKKLNHMTLDCMLEYAGQVRIENEIKYKRAMQKVINHHYGIGGYDFSFEKDKENRLRYCIAAWKDIIRELENLTQ